jgi:hypothetical protein
MPTRPPRRVLSGSNLLGLPPFNPRSSHRTVAQERGARSPFAAEVASAGPGRDHMTDQHTPTEYDQQAGDLFVEQLPPNLQWWAGYNTRSTTGADAGERAKREHRAQSAAPLPVGRSPQ